MRADSPERHDLVWPRPGWRRALRATPSPEALAGAERWFELGRPAVAARTEGGDRAGIGLGIALPPGPGEQQRVALVLGPEAVARVAPPVTLRDAVASAPAGWRAGLVALDRAAREAGLSLRVYGSLSWQHLSGERYLTPASDVDLLVSPCDAGQLRRALRLLAAAPAGVPRIDGEVVLPGGRAVAWRELAAGAERLLVKSIRAVSLVPRSEALAGLDEEGGA